MVRVRSALDGRRTAAPSMHVVKVELLNEDGSLERRVLRDVRDPTREEVVERERTTRKW